MSEIRRNADGPDSGRVVPIPEFRRKTFMEANCGCLGRTVISHARRRDIAGQRSHCNDDAVVFRYHVRQKLAGQAVVLEAVDSEDLLQLFVASFENRSGDQNPGVEHEYGGIAILLLHKGCGLLDRGV